MVSRQQPWHTNPLWAKNARFCSEHINDWKIVQKNEDLNHLWTFLNWNCEMPNFVQNKSPWHRITSMIWSSVKKKSFLWRNGSKVKIWGTYHLPLNKCECFDELKLWKSQHCPLDDCPYDRLVICEIKKTFICKMSKKRPCSQYPNLSTACPQTCNHKSWKELWLLWTSFGPFHVLCATPGLGSQAPPECVSCKNSINEEWLLQLQLVQCLSAGPAAQPRSARARQARRAPKSAGLDWCKLIIVTKWARHDAFYDYIPTTFCLLRLLTYYVPLLYILGTLKSASQKIYFFGEFFATQVEI